MQENITIPAAIRNIALKITNMTTISSFLDKVLKGGANLDQMDFGLSEKKLDDQRINVMDKAMDDAEKKAHDATILMGVKVIGLRRYQYKSFPIHDASFPTALPAASTQCLKHYPLKRSYHAVTR